MMEELSVTMQSDVCDVEQMSEEEILACLVADTEPKFTVRPSGTPSQAMLPPQAAVLHDSRSWTGALNL